MVAKSGWIEFRRSDAAVVVDMVRRVAAAADAGECGDGVEVVIETPARTRWWARWWWTRWRCTRRWWAGPSAPTQARLVVTGAAGVVAYPFDIQLVTRHGGNAARRVGARPGWAISNSAGLAFLIQKGRAGDPFDWPALVAGALAALATLDPDARDTRWRATIDRNPVR